MVPSYKATFIMICGGVAFHLLPFDEKAEISHSAD